MRLLVVLLPVLAAMAQPPRGYPTIGKIVREEVAGTGMYEGLVTTGTVKELVPTKEIQPGVTTYCNQLTGTYKMK